MYIKLKGCGITKKKKEKKKKIKGTRGRDAKNSFRKYTSPEPTTSVGSEQGGPVP